MSNPEFDYPESNYPQLPEGAMQVVEGTYITVKNNKVTVHTIEDQPHDEGSSAHPGSFYSSPLDAYGAPAKLSINLEAPSTELLHIARQLGLNGGARVRSPEDEMLLLAGALSTLALQPQPQVEATTQAALSSKPKTGIESLLGEHDESDDSDESIEDQSIRPKKRMGKFALFVVGGVVTAAALPFTIGPALSQSSSSAAEEARKECGIVLNAGCYIGKISEELNIFNGIDLSNGPSKSKEGSDE